MSQLKQIILIRIDLKMGKGKMIAQGAHASCEAVFKANKKLVKNWRNLGMKKIALKVDSISQIEDLVKKAENLNIVTSIICDAGKTQVDPGTITCAAIGPGPENLIDKITSELKLL